MLAFTTRFYVYAAVLLSALFLPMIFGQLTERGLMKPKSKKSHRVITGAAETYSGIVMGIVFLLFLGMFLWWFFGGVVEEL